MFSRLLLLAAVATVAATSWHNDGTTLSRRQGSSNASASSVPLRIMALGASVTFGVGSSTGNSYRKDLYDLLAVGGRQVSMVGNVQHGDFAQNSCEGFSGFVISQLAAKADAAVPQFQPNLVVVDAGTNNCNNGGTVPDAGRNVSALIGRIFQQSPGATVILATILVNPDARQDSCRVDINTQYQAVAAQMRQQGAKFLLVDMRGPNGPTANDLADRRHPNDGGYAKMANVWLAGVQQAQSSGFLVAPAPVSSNASSSSISQGNMGASSSMASTYGTAPATASATGPSMVGSSGAGTATPAGAVVAFMATVSSCLVFALS